jgi:hypothetical protein
LSSANQQRPNTDPVCDVSNDASNLTMGPALQGNLLRSLMARRRQNKTTDEVSDQTVHNNSINFGEKSHTGNYDSAMKSLNSATANCELSNIEVENKQLKDEITKWKKDHAR